MCGIGEQDNGGRQVRCIECTQGVIHLTRSWSLILLYYYMRCEYIQSNTIRHDAIQCDMEHINGAKDVCTGSTTERAYFCVFSHVSVPICEGVCVCLHRCKLIDGFLCLPSSKYSHLPSGREIRINEKTRSQLCVLAGRIKWDILCGGGWLTMHTAVMKSFIEFYLMTMTQNGIFIFSSCYIWLNCCLLYHSVSNAERRR